MGPAGTQETVCRLFFVYGPLFREGSGFFYGSEQPERTNFEKTAKLMPRFRLVFRLIFLSGAEHVKRIPTWHRLFLLKLQKYLNGIC